MSKFKGTIFVVGASRSGTTMLNRILGQHPSITAMNELHYFGDLFNFSNKEDSLGSEKSLKHAAKLFARYQRGLWNDQITEPDVKDAKNLLKSLPENSDGADLFHQFIEFVAIETEATLVAEQTPRNIYYAADLLNHYADARILHIIRDPRAVIASQKKRWTRRKALNAKNIPLLEMIREWISYHPYSMSLLWKKAYSSGRYIETDKRYMRLRFEDLVDDPEQMVIRICKFLDIPYDSNMLNIPQIDSSVRATDNTAVGIQKTAVDTWKSVLSTGEVLLIEKLLLSEMKDLGYRDLSSHAMIAYLSTLPVFLRFPFHLVGTIMINPQRFFIQLRGLLTQKKNRF